MRSVERHIGLSCQHDYVTFAATASWHRVSWLAVQSQLDLSSIDTHTARPDEGGCVENHRRIYSSVGTAPATVSTGAVAIGVATGGSHSQDSCAVVIAAVAVRARHLGLICQVGAKGGSANHIGIHPAEPTGKHCSVSNCAMLAFEPLPHGGQQGIAGVTVPARCVPNCSFDVMQLGASVQWPHGCHSFC